MTQGITPEKMALTVAVGSALGLFPIIGTTCALCLIFGVMLRLNQPAIQIVNGICWPVHIPVILGLFHLSNWMFHVEPTRKSQHMFTDMFWSLWDHPRMFLEHFGTMLWHLVVAWALVAPIWVGLVYSIALPVLREIVLLRQRECLSREERGAPAKRGVVHPVP